MTAATPAAPSVPAPRILSTGATVRLLVRLKIRLVGRRLGKSGSSITRWLAFALSLVFSVGIGIAGTVVTVAVASDGGVEAQALAVVGLTALVIGWAIFPLVLYGADETVDPARLRLFPLRPRAVVAALGVSALVGPVPLATVLVAVGTVLAWGRGSGVAVVLPAAVVLVAMCVMVSRALLAVLAAALTSRKGRDLVAFLAPLLALAVQGLRFLSLEVSDDTWRAIVRVLRWAPPGMLGQAMVDAHDGRVGVAAAQLVPPMAVVAGAAWVWTRALSRALTEVQDHSRGGEKVRRSRRGAVAGAPSGPVGMESTLVVPFLRRFGPKPWVAVASRELRTLVRHPRARAAVVNLVIVGLAPAVYVSISGALTGRTAILVAAAAGPAAILGAQNQFGLDGPASWTDLATGNLRAVIVGKNVALAVLVLPVSLLASVVLAARSGGWVDIPAILAMAVTALFAGLAVVNPLSVRFAWPIPESGSPFGSQLPPGRGCAVGIVSTMALVVELVAVAPVAIAAVLAAEAGSAPLLLAALVAAVYGYALWRFGLSHTVDYAEGHQPELLASIGRRAA